MQLTMLEALKTLAARTGRAKYTDGRCGELPAQATEPSWEQNGEPSALPWLPAAGFCSPVAAFTCDNAAATR